MSGLPRLCGLAAAALLSSGAIAQVSFATTETGVFNETTVLGSSTIIDGLTVKSADPPPLTFDSAVLIAMQVTPASPVTGDFYLYGSLPTNYLEFQFTKGNETTIGPATWINAAATLISSGGTMDKYDSGFGNLSVSLMSSSTDGGETSGASSVFFEGAIAPAPEPASIAALGVGLIGLVARRRRKR